MYVNVELFYLCGAISVRI